MKELKQYWGSEFERCGFILKSGEIVEVTNIANNPEKEFQVSDEDFEKYYADTVASWHTHTDTFSNLSLSDYYTFLALPEWKHWIVSQHKTVQFYVEGKDVFVGEVIPHSDD